MYKVSEEYMKARKNPVQRYRMTGVVNDVSFTDRNILQGSFSITNQCSDETQVLIGQVYIAELKMTLIGFDAQRYSLKNGKVIPVFGMKVADGSYENVPLGVYTISEANWGTSGIAITAYDNLSLFDRTFSAEKLTGTPYEILDLACKNCGVTLGMSETEVEGLPNGTVSLSLSADNDISTWRDVISWVAQTCAANAFADRNGCLVLRVYNQNVVDTIDAEHRLSGCSFGDYLTRYTGLSVVDQEQQITKYYGTEEGEDDGLTYNLGTNPFLQDKDTVDDCCKNILSALGQIAYVPFKATMIGDPAFDLMDVIRFTGGAADGDQISCITKFSFQYNSKFEIEGVGKNPALATRNDKADKDISGLISQVEAVTESINDLLYDYNTGPMTFGSHEQIIGNITFYASQQVDVEGHFLMSYIATAASHLILRFYDTTVEELFSPCEFDIIEGGGGTIGIPHAYLQRLQGVHSLVVTAQCTSGSVSIDTRAMFFSIDAGNYVESLDDLTMDIRDISVRQLQEQSGPDQIWAIGIENGELLVASRDYDENAKKRPEWTSVTDLGKAVDAAIEFNGYWTRRNTEEVFTLITKDQPWYFWITEDGELLAQEGEAFTTRTTLDTGVSSVHACRGFKSEVDLTKDQGLVVLYTKDGHVWYRQLLYFASADVTKWDNACEVDEAIADADHCSICRLNDYRMAVTIHSESAGTKIYITDRTYVMQSVPREVINLPDEGTIPVCLYPADYDPTVQVSSQSLSDDLLTYTVTYNKLFTFAGGGNLSSEIEQNYSYGGDLTGDETKVKSVSVTENTDDKTTTLVVVFEKIPETTKLKRSYKIILNPDENTEFWAVLDEYGYERFSPVTATFDVDFTNYITAPTQQEEIVLPVSLGNESTAFVLTPVGKLRSDNTENVVLPTSVGNGEEALFYEKKGVLASALDENVTLPSALTNEADAAQYYDKNTQPI